MLLDKGLKNTHHTHFEKSSSEEIDERNTEIIKNNHFQFKQKLQTAG